MINNYYEVATRTTCRMRWRAYDTLRRGVVAHERIAYDKKSDIRQKDSQCLSLARELERETFQLRLTSGQTPWDGHIDPFVPEWVLERYQRQSVALYCYPH